MALVRHNRLEQLARLAGRADDQPLTPAQQFGLGDNRHTLEIFEVTVGNQPVEISQADGVFCKENDVPCAAVENLRARTQLGHDGVDLRERMHTLFLEHLPEAHHHMPAGDRIVGRAVVIEFRQTQCVGHEIKLVFAQLRQQVLRQNERIDICRLELDPQPLCSRHNKSNIKIGVVRAERPPCSKIEELEQRFGDIRRAFEHLVGDARQLDNLRREPTSRRDKGLERIHYLAAAHDDRADLDNYIMLGGQARRLEVKRHIFRVKRRVNGAVDGNTVVHIIDIVSFAAVQDLDVFIRTGDLGLAGGL